MFTYLKYSYKHTFMLILFSSLTFLSISCSDTISTNESSGVVSGLPSDLEAAVAKVNNPISKNQGIKIGERALIELSNKELNFAGYYIDNNNSRDVEDDKLVVWLKGNNVPASRKEEVKSFISRFSNSKMSFNASNITFREAEYNFLELQAIRDILVEPLLKTEGVIYIDLAEQSNRIVIGVENKEYLRKIENSLSTLDIPRQAVELKITGKSIVASHIGSNN